MAYTEDIWDIYRYKFDNIPILLSNLRMYAVAPKFHLFPLVHGNMETCTVVRVCYKEIICVNVEHGGKNSIDESGNILPTTF